MPLRTVWSAVTWVSTIVQLFADTPAGQTGGLSAVFAHADLDRLGEARRRGERGEQSRR